MTWGTDETQFAEISTNHDGTSWKLCLDVFDKLRPISMPTKEIPLREQELNIFLFPVSMFDFPDTVDSQMVYFPQSQCSNDELHIAEHRLG